MKIWIVEIGEPLPVEPEARLLATGLATRRWAAQGHEVTWWSSTFSHQSRRHFFSSDQVLDHDGCRLILLHGPGYQKSVSLGRIQHQRHFARKLQERLAQETPPDIFVAPIPTIEAASVSMRYSQQHGVPFVLDIRDEWPEEWVDLAPRPFQTAARLALTPYFRAFERLCRGADALLAGGDKFLEYGLKYAGRTAHDRDAVIPFGYPDPQLSETQKGVEENRWLECGVKPDHFVVCFFGTMGEFFDLGTVIEAARALRHQPVQFVLCGDGSRRAHFEALARGLPNVLFPGWVNQQQIFSLMSLSSAGLAPYRKGARMALPNKPLEYLAGGLPILSSLPGQLQRLLRDEQVGLHYEADNPNELLSAVEQMRDRPEEHRKMGIQARRLFLERFEIEKTLDQRLRHLTHVFSVVDPPSPEKEGQVTRSP